MLRQGRSESGSGNTVTVACVLVTDVWARNDPHRFLNRVSLARTRDFNQDSFVTVSDGWLARGRGTNFIVALQRISTPGAASGAAAGEGEVPLKPDLVW